MELPHKYCYGPHKCDSISRFSWIWQFYDKTSQPRKLACLQSLSLKAAPEAWCSLGMEISDLWNSNIVAHCTSSITTMYNTSQEVADTPELVVVHEADDVSHTRTWPRLEPLHTGIRRWKLQSPSLSSSWNPRMALNSSLFSYLQLLWAISFLNFLRQRQHKLWYPLHSLPLPLQKLIYGQVSVKTLSELSRPQTDTTRIRIDTSTNELANDYMLTVLPMSVTSSFNHLLPKGANLHNKYHNSQRT